MGREVEVDVAALRERLGWSQRRLAEEIGCHQSQISRIEAGGARASGAIRAALRRIAAEAPASNEAAA